MSLQNALLTIAGDVRAAGHRAPTILFDEDGVAVSQRGGSYANGDREARGYTGDEVRAVRSLLHLFGRRVTLGEAEGVLQEALEAWDEGARPKDERTSDAEQVASARRQGRARLRAQARGLCCACKSVRARAGMATCEPCSIAARSRVKAWRAEKRQKKYLQTA